ncbi:small basic family protein [Sinanaerobacter chloroacetimidivorans]|jgi:small basic protein|uniref:Small basic family protein n=1 Tax=Sinanaerobacter chloroacetimidivorans TaxID=2818044 RepID=A0A8J7VXW1_9FIRM|nr:small basic family protein [Sinanaerobacter chloroacetimidivorans]MBR0597059.1 small basic family protein [Sinanaerobacter chloroacetimidivorans]
MIIAMIIGLLGGIILGFTFNISYPTEYSFYITMGLLAAIDSILGAARSHLEEKYNNLIFISGFITNALLAGVLAYLGDRLGVPLYYAAILVFGGRLFQNIAVIRRLLIDKYFIKKDSNINKK